jgi:hypothetical protein
MDQTLTRRPRRRSRLLLIMFAACAALLMTCVADAHVLDEYLQATLVDIEPNVVRLKITLTPGVDVADPILALMNPNRDDVISATEAAHYVELLKRDLTVRLDGRELELKLTASSFPEPAELRTGRGIVQIEFSVAPGAMSADEHTLTIENRHLPSASVYLANATRPTSDAIRIIRQDRNQNQSSVEIAFAYAPTATPLRSTRTVASLAVVMVVLAVCVGASRMRRIGHHRR